jgi:hypothetical protein
MPRQSTITVNGTLVMALALAGGALCAEHVGKPLLTKHYVPSFMRREGITAGSDPDFGFDVSRVVESVKSGERLVLFDGCIGCSATTTDDVILLSRIASRHTSTRVVVVCETADRQGYDYLIETEKLSNVITLSREQASPLNLEFSPRLYVVDSAGNLEFIQSTPIALRYYDAYLRGVVP